MERRELERRLGKPCLESAWRLLVEEHYVQEYIDGEIELDELVRVYRRKVTEALTIAREYEARPRPPTRVRVSPDKRAQVISKLLATIAADNPLVSKFRRKYLPEGLLEAGEVEAWLQSCRERDGPPKVRTAGDWKRSPSTFANYEPNEEQEGPLFYRRAWVFDGQVHQTEPGVPVGAIDDLLLVAEYLSLHFDFDPVDAMTFVMTGEVPTWLPIQAIGRRTLNVLHERARITMVVDPEASPREVVEVYRSIRRQYYPGRSRPLHEKTLELVSFVLDHSESHSPSTKTMDAWNNQVRDKHPKWVYSKLSNFSKDFYRAARRLLRGRPIQKTEEGID